MMIDHENLLQIIYVTVQNRWLPLFHIVIEQYLDALVALIYQ